MSGEVVIAGGAGDNAAGAAGIGTVVPGRAFLSLGTSGVLFAANRAYAPNPERAVHAFCHCFPDTWHQMSVILSAAASLAWAATVTGAGDEAALVAEAATAEAGLERVPLFLPYLTGERTPHNDPHAKGVFFGLDQATRRGDLGWAVLEGVAFAFADGHDALLEAGTEIDETSVIGGGARSALWGRILVAALRRPLTYHTGSEVGPALGAARLARLAATGERPARSAPRRPSIGWSSRRRISPNAWPRASSAGAPFTVSSAPRCAASTAPELAADWTQTHVGKRVCPSACPMRRP